MILPGSDGRIRSVFRIGLILCQSKCAGWSGCSRFAASGSFWGCPSSWRTQPTEGLLLITLRVCSSFLVGGL